MTETYETNAWRDFTCPTPLDRVAEEARDPDEPAGEEVPFGCEDDAPDAAAR